MTTLVGYSGAKQIGAFGKPNDQRLIQRELMARGPVTVVFRLTEDFYMHQSGIFYVSVGLIVCLKASLFSPADLQLALTTS